MAWMTTGSLRQAAAARLLQLRRTPSASTGGSGTTTTPALLLLLRRRAATSSGTTTTRTRRPGGGDGNDGDGAGVVIENPSPGMAPLPEDAPRQTPPRVGEEDPAGLPMPTTSKDKMGGGAATDDGGIGEAAPGGMPDTAPPPDVPVPPVSPDGSNV